MMFRGSPVQLFSGPGMNPVAPATPVGVARLVFVAGAETGSVCDQQPKLARLLDNRSRRSNKAPTRCLGEKAVRASYSPPTFM